MYIHIYIKICSKIITALKLRLKGKDDIFKLRFSLCLHIHVLDYTVIYWEICLKLVKQVYTNGVCISLHIYLYIKRSKYVNVHSCTIS